jgi:hypothetical protein
VRTRGQAPAPEAPAPSSRLRSAGAPPTQTPAPPAEQTPSRIPPPSPVRSARTGKASRAAPKQAGPEDIVLRVHGQRMIISRDESADKPATQQADAPAKKGKAKSQSQLSLPIWGEEPKKKK